MYQSALSASDEQATNSQGFNGRILTLLTSEELEQGPCLPGLENILCHTPLARVRVSAKQKHTGPIFAAPLSRPAIPRTGAPFLSAIC